MCQILLTFLSFPPNSPVKTNHNSDWQVERCDGGAECDILVGLDELNIAFPIWNAPEESMETFCKNGQITHVPVSMPSLEKSNILIYLFVYLFIIKVIVIAIRIVIMLL